MEASEYVGALRRRWLVIAICMVCCAVVGFAVARSAQPLYRATSSVFVSPHQGDTANDLLEGSTYAQNLMQSYAQLVKLPTVLDPVIDELNLDMSAKNLADSITVETPLNTVLIEIRVSNPSPSKAANIANEVTDALAEEVRSLSPRLANGSPAIVMKQVGVAETPQAPYAPNTKFITLTAGLIGLIIGVVYALGRQMFGTRIRTEADLQRVTDLPVLGKVPVQRGQDKSSAPMRVRTHGSAAEAYRRIAANLKYINPDSQIRTVMVSSSLSGEGKTSVSINLALALSENFGRVLLVDADLRQPMLAEYCQVEGSVGLTNLLTETTAVDDVVQAWGSIDILTSGMVPPNPQQLVGSDAMTELLSSMTRQYDVVVLDTAPITPVADSLALSRNVDGVVLVGSSNSTRLAQLAAAIESIQAVNGTILGLVLNRVKRERRGGGYRYGSLPTHRYDDIGDVSRAQPREGSRAKKLQSLPPHHG